MYFTGTKQAQGCFATDLTRLYSFQLFVAYVDLSAILLVEFCRNGIPQNDLENTLCWQAENISIMDPPGLLVTAFNSRAVFSSLYFNLVVLCQQQNLLETWIPT